MQEIGLAQTVDVTCSAHQWNQTEPSQKKPHYANYHILLVDDDPLVRAGLGAALRAWGYQVSAADTIEVALTKLSNIDMPIDLVISDYDLGHDNGITLVSLLHSHIGRQLPCIIVTAHGDEKTLNTIREYNLPTLIKPLDMHMLKAEITSFLGKKS